MGLEGGDAGLKATDVAKIMDGHINDQAEVRDFLNIKSLTHYSF